MNRILCVAAALALPMLSALAAEKTPDPLTQWAQWRGPLGTGVAPHGDPPVRWSETENIRWKTEIPGLGHSTPIVWGDRIFLTTAIPHGEIVEARADHAHGAHDNVAPGRSQRFVVLAIDRRDGAILWQRTVRKARPHESVHETGTWASNSPVTDGTSLFVSFGSHGIFCLDMQGKVRWEADLGDMQTKHGHGEGSSPALHGDSLVVNWDHEGQSFLAALDKRTGKPRWKIERDEGTSWSTPLVVEHAGRAQVIVSATRRVRAYDLDDGKLIWECGGLSGNVVASPVAADGYVYVANSYETRSMLAIRLAGATGDITDTDAVAWRRDRDTPYVPSPVLHEGSLCFLKHYQGFLTCLVAQTGKTLFGPRRLDGIRSVFASPVAAAGRIYIVDRNGTTAVVKHAAEFEQMARNLLEDSFSASPAIVGSEIYLRGERHLYRISIPAAD